MTNPLAAATLVGPETVVVRAAGDQIIDGVATLTGGARVALFEDYGTSQYELSINGGAPIVAAAMNDTALPGGGFSLEANSFLPGSRASIAALGNGEFIVTWVDGTVTTQTLSGGGSTLSGPTILGQLYDAAGAPVGSQLVFSGDVVTTSSAQSVSAAATVYAPVSASALGTSGYLVAVPSTFESGLGTSDGVAFFGPPALQPGLDLADHVAAAPFAEAAIATANYAWVAYAVPGLFGGELTIKVTDFTGLLVSVAAIPSAGVQQLAVAQSGTDSIALAWVEGSHVKVATAAESPTGLASQSLDLGTGSAPQVAAQANGLFAVTWQDADASGQGIYAELFYADGTAASQKIQVNTITDGDQTAPHITALGNNQFLIEWTDASHEAVAGQTADTSGLGIKSQVVSFANPGVAPAITAITQNDPQHTDAAHVHYTVHFSEPVSGLSPSSFSLVTQGISGASIASVLPVTGDYSEEVVTVNTGTGVGTIALHAAAGITDFFGNPTTAAADGPAYDTFLVTVLSVTPNIASGTLGRGQELIITVALNDAVSVVGTPVLNLNDGGAAVYDAAHSTATSLVFDYTVGRGEHTGALAVTGVDLQNAAIISARGTTPDLSGLATTFDGLAIDGFDAPPVAQAGSARGNENSVIAGTVTASDIDTAQAQLRFGLSGANGGAQHGAVVLNTDGTFSYTPNANYHGTDSFSFKANDGVFDSNVATENLTVDFVTVLSVEPDIASGTLGPGQHLIITVALSDAVSVVGTPVLNLNDGGAAVYDAAHSTATSLVFDYTVGRGELANALAVTGAGLQNASITSAGGTAPDLSGLATTFNGLAVNGANDGFMTAENVPLAALTVFPGVTAVDGFTAAVGHPIALGSGARLTVNADGSFSYDPNHAFDSLAAGASATDSFNYTVTGGTTTVATVTIDGVDTAPVAQAGAASGIENGRIAGTVTASDVDTAQALLRFGLSGTNGGAQHGAVLLNTDGTFSYTPDANYYGTDSFSFTANDGLLASNVASENLTVFFVDQAPAVGAPVQLPPITVDGGPDLITQAQLLGNASDAGGHALSAIHLAISSGSGTLVDNHDGTWSYTPAAGDGTAVSFSYQVTDGIAAPVADSASLDIAPRPSAHNPANGSENDFSGNGHSGILWQNADGTPAIWTMDGTSLTSGSSIGANPGSDWHVVGSGDFNGDGKSDILWQNKDGTIAEWFLNGTSVISGGSVGFNPGPAWHAVGAGDFNGDGKSDILFQNTDGTPAVWLMNGLNVLSGANVGFNPGPDWHVIGAADFNGDGKSDILWQNTNGQAAVWLMNGTNLLSGANVGFNPGADWHIVGTGDFNGDGKADILWQNAKGQAAVWLMDGTNVLSGSNVGFNPGPSWHAVGTGDFNGDGKSDILWQNDDGTSAVWLMNGTSVISGANVGDPGTSWHVVPQHHDLFA